MTTLHYIEFDSPVGVLRIVADRDALRQIDFHSARAIPAPDPAWVNADDTLLREAKQQLQAWFAGDRRAFELPLAPEGTPFQRDVWDALCRIPYGETVSYGDIAADVGRPDASRAVGAACGRNPLPIVIPCHRVVGRNGSLTGFGGGIEAKKTLLAVEGQQALALTFDLGEGARIDAA